MKLKVIKPFRDKFTKEDYEVGREIECDDDLAESRLKLGLVERIEKGNRSSKKNSIPSTEPENKENPEKIEESDENTDESNDLDEIDNHSDGETTDSENNNETEE